MAKVIKIFHTLNGGVIQNEQNNESSSLSPVADSRLESIPTISEVNNTVVDKTKDTVTVTSINNLNTIKESAIISEEESYSSSKNKLNPVETKRDEQSITKKKDEESDSSCFTQRSFSKKSKFSKMTKKSGVNEINETCRVTHLSNKKFEFSEKFVSDDLEKQFLMSQGTNNTPYKPEEINNEIYPNENFMKYNSSTNNIYKIINNKSDISVCSTEVSFSIQSKYENIDELSDYRYSKTPKLRNKIKMLLKSHDIDSEENSIIITKVKNQTFKKSFVYSSEKLSSEKKNTLEIKKYIYDDIFDKKKKNKNKNLI